MSSSLLSHPIAEPTDAERIAALRDVTQSPAPRSARHARGTSRPVSVATRDKKKKPKKKPKKLPVCTAKDLKKPKHKRRKCRVVKKRPSPAGGAAAAPVTPVEGTEGLRIYRGSFGRDQATRLLFRAGFGPLPGQADQLAGMGLEAAVDHLMNPGAARLEGPAPSGDYLVGGQFAPNDKWGHGHLEWLDRIARSTDQIGERMALVLHDWIAISADGIDGHYVRDYIDLLRNGWRGSFRQLVQDLTVNPAMLIWLNGLGSEKESPNENYAREIQEMFCLGADRGAYTEQDIRELARAFTGWDADWVENVGLTNFRFNSDRWDPDQKVIYAGTPHERRGNLNYRDAVNAVVDHPLHASWVALRLWTAFVPTPPTQAVVDQLAALYRNSGERLEPLVKAILLHPDIYRGPSMTKSPITFVGGLLRGRASGISTDAWSWICDSAGQMLWYPPNVSGWNERAWLNTTTFEARWNGAAQILFDNPVPDGTYDTSTENATQAVDAALAFWGNPSISAAHRAVLQAHAEQAMTLFYWDDDSLKRQMRQSTLRMLVTAAPDHQVS